VHISSFEDVLVLTITWNDLFCRCVDDESVWWQLLIFVFLCPKRWFQFNSRIVRTHISSTVTEYWKMIAEPQSYIFRWRSRFRRCHVCLSFLMVTCRRRNVMFLSRYSLFWNVFCRELKFLSIESLINFVLFSSGRTQMKKVMLTVLKRKLEKCYSSLWFLFLLESKLS